MASQCVTICFAVNSELIARNNFTVLTKLGYLIDNPWSNALDRARAAGAVLADVLLHRHLGVRPVSLIGFSLGARVIFYALVELAKAKAFGIVQEVYLLGATLTASRKQWREVRGVVSGRFVNAYARNDWILGYLFRATTGGLQTVAGLRPVDHVPDLENVDITELLVGHMSYRSKMPVLLKHLGFRTTADTFDEIDQDDANGPDREIVSKEEEERRRIEKEKKLKKANRWKWGKRKQAANTATPTPEEASVATEDSMKINVEYDAAPASMRRSSMQSSVASTSPRSSIDNPRVASPTPSVADSTIFNVSRIRNEIAAIEAAPSTPIERPKSAADFSPTEVKSPIVRPATADFTKPSADTVRVQSPQSRAVPSASAPDSESDSDDAPQPAWKRMAAATSQSSLPSWDKPAATTLPFPSINAPNPFAMEALNASTISFGGPNGEVFDEAEGNSWSSAPPKSSVAAANPWS